ncbi:hypothetical protein CANTEDRAFT_115067 [Yamadazyma tenuis ATCC 10573]|uniref:Damage-regulated import facilitator 1 n=1 Tax=Candida tenuis (strain ATCC 10573 / BCRC 21748 / CBS 615 / JCM 9827 / NBRC 10315 / NRRL Y-1498 / VKM Y-70) TaxID=590646 RepID=G3B7A9_CANTC|nr:uncharacterized protein CANTEDRAFT_115067 [Yamadazyma tenuis ATCC 10573]EGV61611.1 hypothetical protein CANTEDRAFT_115067 [Yamadazyma tenuis ATCC 10573]
MNDYKRIMTHPAPAGKSEEENTLATLGMRIRKSIADGYSGPSHSSYSYKGNANVKRQPLPSHVSQPPALSNSSSTFDSSSSLSEWDSSFSSVLQTIPQVSSNKRRMEDSENSYIHPVYGVLRTDEEF